MEDARGLVNEAETDNQRILSGAVKSLRVVFESQPRHFWDLSF